MTIISSILIGEKDMVGVHITVDVVPSEPSSQSGHNGAILLALARCTASILKEMGAADPHAAADIARDQVLLAWEGAKPWREYPKEKRSK